MKKNLKKLSLAVIFAMAVSLITPAAQVAEAATTKTFTYAEQKTGDTVTTLVMNKGEKVDLKFNGVSNWKTYKYKWVSSNTKVAVVDSAGMITALSEGVATIKLTVSGGDGTKYTSTGVTVYVDSIEQEVTIGTSSKDEIKSYTMEMNQKIALKANGIKDNVGGRYEFSWSSTDTSVATINEKGIITPVAPGLSVIQLTVKKVFSGEEFEATPIALLVKGEGEAPAATATPAPTKKPSATATPAPTKKPDATATPTPTATPIPTVTPVPSDEYVGYSVTLKSDKELLLTFDQKVDYTTTDIQLYQLITAGSTVIPVKWEVANVTTDSTGRQLSVVPVIPFSNGDKYMVKAGSADVNGSAINVIIGEPNRIEITYKCLGTEGVAYAYDDASTIDVPVELSYRLYFGNIDVTETYADRGYMSYGFAANKYYDNVVIGDNTLHFYAPNVSVALTGTYTYYNDQGISKDLTGTVAIRSTKLPAYGIIGVVNSTIIDGSAANFGKIDWNNTTSQIVANKDNAKLVAMLADTYGNFYVTDERGVDKANNIYYINDVEQLFSKYGYGVEFSAADQNQIIVAPDGSIYPFKATSGTVILVTLTNNGLSGSNNYSRTIGACQVRVLDESKLSSMTADTTRVTLATSAMPGYENRFCEADVKILFKDQYGNKWSGTTALEVSSTVAAVNNALDGSSLAPARLDGTTLHIDAKNIRSVTNVMSVPLTVTDTLTNKRVTINVTLQNPTTANGSINVTGWNLGLQNSTISLGEPEDNEWVQYAAVEAYKTSSNGIKVGLYDDLHILTTSNHTFTTSNCSAGQVYVLVKGPDNKVVPMAANSDSLGVYVDSANNCVKVNVAAPKSSGSLVQDTLAAGTYTVTATRIVNVGTVVQKNVLNTSFTVVDNTKDVTFRAVKSVSTPLTVSGSNDQAGVKEVAANCLTFNLDGEAWTTLTSNMITNVEYIMNGNTVVIRKVEFAVPVDGTNPYGMSYIKTCEVNKAIKTGVVE
ncbi:MAG: Ig-like domain-containing protein [Lachnospiraceae bacterium]|nr:Ig-like domain-containing protein [Lachnospiraceae bacterium]